MSPRHLLAATVLIAAAAFARPSRARSAEPLPAPEDEPSSPAVDPEPPSSSPIAPSEPIVTSPPPRAPEPIAVSDAPPSEGRLLVSLYNSGFQWGIAPGVIVSRGNVGFALGLRLGYGFDIGSVILVPGARVAAYFVDPNVYLGMPTFKVVLPIDRFAPFVEGGVGIGHVDDPAKTGTALMAGGGFMIHFPRFAFGAEASYQAIAGTGFKGFGVGPILAFGF